MEKNQARLLFEAGKCLIEIRNYLRPQGFSQQSLIDRPYELKSALTNYPKEKIQGYLNILEKYDLREETKTRSEEHTSELQSHSFISYAVFCLKKKKKKNKQIKK